MHIHMYAGNVELACLTWRCGMSIGERFMRSIRLSFRKNGA